MKYCQEIKKDNVFKKALVLIDKAKKSIDVSMDIEEEINQPLPPKYHKKLLQIIHKGIKTKRLVYGQKKLFKKITTLYPNVNTVYKGGIKKYQRFLIIDKKMGLFSIGSLFFFSRYQPLIKSLLEYANIDE